MQLKEEKHLILWFLLVFVMIFCATSAWADPVVPGFRVDVYTHVPTPAKLSFAPSGELFVGNDGELVTIHRIGPGGFPVESYGDTPLNDPDSVIFDAGGGISGTPGSVLVGNMGGNIVAILPDQTTIPVFGPEDGFVNPAYMDFDRTGRLLISDQGGPFRVVAATGDSITEIGLSFLAVTADGANRVYTAYLQNQIKVYSPGGVELSDLTPVDANSDRFYGLEFGPYDAVWQGQLYAAMQTGDLYRITPEGDMVLFGSGFSTDGRSDLAFGPDGALYVSDASADVIYRITPGDGVTELIVDNADPDFQSGPEPWATSQFTPGGYNSTYAYAPPGDGEQFATWFFLLEESGNCTVSAQWTAFENRSTAAPFTIVNNDNPILVTVDQTQGGGRFNSLGTYWMEAGPVAVVLTDAPDGHVIADAVRLVCESSQPPMPIKVDNTDADFATEGAWGTSSYSSGYYGDNYSYASPDSGGKAATWTFSITQGGNYEISAQWSAASNRSPMAPYSIVNNGDTLGVETVDQTIDGGQFNSLGVFFLEAGTLEVILNDNVNGYVIADAVQVIPQ